MKEAVFGIYEREDGIVYIKPVVDVTKDIIKDKVNIETRIYSDTWESYNGLEEDFKSHRVVLITGTKSTSEARRQLTALKGFGVMPKNAY